jgi:hypothetical protein
MILCREYDGVSTLLGETLLRYQEQGKILSAAEVLTLFANLAVAQGLAERALCLAGASLANCESLTKLIYPRQQVEFERTQAAARQMLGPQAAAVAWAAGQAMTLEQAVDYALQATP